MIRWLKRGLWLVAWSVWIWLGFGLYRELPRDLGPAIAKISVGKNVQDLGFIDDSNLVALAIETGGDASTIAVVDVETGRRFSETPGPSLRDYIVSRHGNVFTRRLPKTEPGANDLGLYMIDLKAPTWKRVSRRKANQISVHSERPWVVFTEAIEGEGRRQPFYVVDFRSGKEIAVESGVPSSPWQVDARFLPGTDRVFVFTRHDRAHFREGETKAAEIWRMADPPVMEKRIVGISFGPWQTYSTTGMVAFTESFRDADADVYDLYKGEYVFSYPPLTDRTGAFASIGVWPTITLDGKRLIAGDPATLWNLENKKAIWVPGQFDRSSPGSLEHFQVTEWWSSHWYKLAPKLSYKTYSLRSMKDGSLYLRTSADLHGLATRMNKQKTLAIDAMTGDVYRLPLPANWKLLTLCQTILGLPLLLLWSVLYLLKRRRLRRAAKTLVSSNPD